MPVLVPKKFRHYERATPSLRRLERLGGQKQPSTGQLAASRRAPRLPVDPVPGEIAREQKIPHTLPLAVTCHLFTDLLPASQRPLCRGGQAVGQAVGRPDAESH
jgi:hypothetical protein